MNAKQARAAIKELNNNGRSPAQILSAIVRNGGEWPAVVWAITDALKLTPKEVEEMEADA
jgi:hypothetical protein